MIACFFFSGGEEIFKKKSQTSGKTTLMLSDGCYSGEAEEPLTGQLLNLTDSTLATDSPFNEEAPEYLITEN